MATFGGGGGRGGNNAPGGVETIDLCSDDGGSDDEVQVVQVNRPAGSTSAATNNKQTARDLVAGGGADGAEAASGGGGGGGAVVDGFDPSCIPTIERYVHLPLSGTRSATGSSGRPTVTGVTAAASSSASASASAGGGGAAAAAAAAGGGGKPKFVPKSKAKSNKTGAQKKTIAGGKKRKQTSVGGGGARAAADAATATSTTSTAGPTSARKRPAQNATSGRQSTKRPTKISPPAAGGMSLSQAHSLLFDGGSTTPADNTSIDANKRKKKKYKKSRSRSASPGTATASAASATAYNTSVERKRPGFGAMCKEMGRYLQSIANGRGWLAMDPDLAAWADEQREEYAHYLGWKKMERLEGGNGTKRRRGGRNRPKLTEEMVEKLCKIGFDLDDSTGMSPPRKAKVSSSSTSRGAAVTVTQWNDDDADFDDTNAECTGNGTKSSDTTGSRQARRNRKRQRRKKRRTASEDIALRAGTSQASLPGGSVSKKSKEQKSSFDVNRSNETNRPDGATSSANVAGETNSSIARASSDDVQEKLPLRVFNDPGDPVCDIEIANQSESEGSGAGIFGEDEDDSRANDEEFAFNYIPLVERIVMLDSETNQPLSPSKQPPPRIIGMQPIMTPPRKETAQDATEAIKAKANAGAETEQKETHDKTASEPGAKESAQIASEPSASSSSSPTAPPIQRAKTEDVEEESKKKPKGSNESSPNDQKNSHGTFTANDGGVTKKSSDDIKSNLQDTEVSKLKAEVDALRAQLEEERRRRELAEAARRHDATNIVSGGEEEPDNSKEGALQAKVKAEAIEINDDSDEPVDNSSKPSANDPTPTPPSASQEKSTPSTQQVDQRMNGAVKTILSYPEVAPYDALCSAGYVFEEIEAGQGSTLVDQNGISLERRKEELGQLVQSKKKIMAQSNEAEPSESTNPCNAPIDDGHAKKPASSTPMPSNPYAKKKKPVQTSPMANLNAKSTPSVPATNPYAKPAQTSSRASSTSSATSKIKTTDRTGSSAGREVASKQCSTCKEVHPRFRFSNEQWSNRNGYCHKCMVIERQKQAQTAWPPRQEAQWLHRRDRSSEKKKASAAHRLQDYLYSQQEQQERLFREAAERVKQQQRMAQQQQQQHPASSSWASAGSSWVRAGPSYSAPVDDINKLPANHWTWPDSHARLGLPKTATIAQIKKQFRKMALKYHPDKNSGSSSLQAWHAIKEAYEKISS